MNDYYCSSCDSYFRSINYDSYGHKFCPLCGNLLMSEEGEEGFPEEDEE